MVHDEYIDLDFSPGEGAAGPSANFLKSGDLNNLLVGLYDTHRDYNRVQSGDPAFKEALCVQMTDLLSATNRVADREMITDVLIALLRQSSIDLKAALAERLSTLECVPLRLLLQLINDDIAVARPILKSSPALNDLDLLYIIQSRDTTFWQVIAGRRAICENVVDALVDTHDVPTARVLIDNDTITLSGYSVGVLNDMAQTARELAQPLLSRKDVPETVSRALYELVGEAITSSLDSVADRGEMSFDDVADVRRVVRDVIVEFSNPYPDSSDFIPTPAMMRASEMFMEQGKLNPVLMLRTLIRGQVSSFVAQLSVYCQLPVAVVVPVLRQQDGKSFALAARSCDMSRAEFVALFEQVQRHVQRKIEDDVKNRDKAAGYFDRLTVDIARKIMKRNHH